MYHKICILAIELKQPAVDAEYGSLTSNKWKELFRELRFELCENTFHARAFYDPPGNDTPIFCDSFHTNFAKKISQ